MNFCVEGTDPGAKGAIAFLYPDDGLLAIYDLPIAAVTGSTRVFHDVDSVALADLLRQHDPVHGYLEKVHAFPGEGAVGSFSFGDNFGSIKGVHAGVGIPLTRVAPETWKKNLRVPKDKKQAVARARELFPACSLLFTRPDRAEAALIGLYGALNLGHAPKRKFIPFGGLSHVQEQEGLPVSRNPRPG